MFLKIKVFWELHQSTFNPSHTVCIFTTWECAHDDNYVNKLPRAVGVTLLEREHTLSLCLPRKLRQFQQLQLPPDIFNPHTPEVRKLHVMAELCSHVVFTGHIFIFKYGKVSNNPFFPPAL